MALEADPLPAPPHFLDSMPPWLDVSSYRAFDLEGMTPKMIARGHYDDPKDKAFMFLRVNAIRERRQWEMTHPHGPVFPGVFLGSK